MRLEVLSRPSAKALDQELSRLEKQFKNINNENI